MGIESHRKMKEKEDAEVAANQNTRVNILGTSSVKRKRVDRGRGREKDWEKERKHLNEKIKRQRIEIENLRKDIKTIFGLLKKDEVDVVNEEVLLTCRKSFRGVTT